MFPLQLYIKKIIWQSRGDKNGMVLQPANLVSLYRNNIEPTNQCTLRRKNKLKSPKWLFHKNALHQNLQYTILMSVKKNNAMHFYYPILNYNITF